MFICLPRAPKDANKNLSIVEKNIRVAAALVIPFMIHFFAPFSYYFALSSHLISIIVLSALADQHDCRQWSLENKQAVCCFVVCSCIGHLFDWRAEPVTLAKHLMWKKLHHCHQPFTRPAKWWPLSSHLLGRDDAQHRQYHARLDHAFFIYNFSSKLSGTLHRHGSGI